MDRKIIVGFSILVLLMSACADHLSIMPQPQVADQVTPVPPASKMPQQPPQVADQVKSGRTALLSGKPEEALPHFRQAADTDPNYANDFTPLKEGVWTYLGRAYYDSRNFPEAEKALKQALARNANDFMARLYFGLTVIQIQPTTKPPTPLSLEQILTLLRSTVTADQVATFVKERGISFSLNQENETEIRRAGANDKSVDKLVEQLKRPPRVSTEQRPSQGGLKNMEIALKEIHDWLDQVSQKPESWDPQRQIRAQIDKTLRGINNMGRQQVLNAGDSIGKTLEAEIDLAQTRASAN